MKRRNNICIFALLALLLVFSPLSVKAHPHIIDTENGTEINPELLLEDLRQAQVIFMGEFHDHPGHHQAQLAIINALDNDQAPLAIGLEMFRKESQKELDQWVNNDIPLHKFIDTYNDNWSMWPLYQDIFLHARQNRIKMLGLNISRNITSKVSTSGFKSLSEEQRQLLGNVQCVVNKEYNRFIRQAMGGFGGHGDNFLYFCEAQLLWDTMMARHLVEFLKENENYRVVVLAGSGHAWKYGIPRQMMMEAEIDYRVILPEIIGRADRNNITNEIADYLWLDVGKQGWSLQY